MGAQKATRFEVFSKLAFLTSKRQQVSLIE
jgi:hypothetical protein